MAQVVRITRWLGSRPRGNGLVPAIKTLRNITGYGLKESKDILDPLFSAYGISRAFEVSDAQCEALRKAEFLVTGWADESESNAAPRYMLVMKDLHVVFAGEIGQADFDDCADGFISAIIDCEDRRFYSPELGDFVGWLKQHG